jgi:hypothetical protein
MASFYFGQNPLTKRVGLHEQTSETIRACIDPELVTQAQAWLKVTKSDQAIPGYGVTHVGREQYGAEDFAQVKGERYMIDGVEHDGQVRRTHLVRPVGGGRFESRTVIEERVGPHTLIAKEVR